MGHPGQACPLLYPGGGFSLALSCTWTCGSGSFQVDVPVAASSLFFPRILLLAGAPSMEGRTLKDRQMALHPAALSQCFFLFTSN